MRKFPRIKAALLLAVVVCSPFLLAASSKQDAKPAVDPVALEEFLASKVTDVYDLEQWFVDRQWEWLPLIPPAEDFILRQPSGQVLPFDLEKFPAEFKKSLPVHYENSVPAYNLRISESRLTRQILFFNEKGEQVFALAPASGYDPLWFLKDTRPELFSGRYTPWYVDSLSRLFDPSRLEMEVTLVPSAFSEFFLYTQQRVAEEAAAQALASGSGGGVVMMMYSGPPVSNITFTAIERRTNLVRVTLAYPYDGATYPDNCFTNRLDIFQSSDLLESWWRLAVTTNVSPSTNWIEWTDSSVTASWVVVRFYAAGNADIDSDSDGFADAREKFMYHTDPSNSTSRPVNVAGSVSYSGSETGTIHVLAVSALDSWSLGCSAAIPGPGAYSNSEVATLRDWWFKGFRDVNTNLARDTWEPWGLYSSSSTYVTSDVSGVNITISDVPSIWGTISYTGTKTGDVYVIAVTASNSWDTTYSCMIPWVQGDSTMTGGTMYLTFPVNYSITGLPASNFWIRAFIDTDADQSYTFLEDAAGQYPSNSIPVSNRVTGVNFTLEYDSDSDGMPDWWEYQYGLNPHTTNDAGQDVDSDGLSNASEYTWQTDPGNPDTDGDGASDGDEVTHSTNPLNNPGDADSDGLSDDLEIVLGSDPNDPDSDFDFAADGFEVQEGFDPLNSTNTPPLHFMVNNSDLYTRSTWLSLTFTGVVADVVLISEASDMIGPVTNTMASNVLCVLSSSTNGWRDVHVQLGRVSDGQRSGTMSSGITLDTVAPTVSVTNPTNGYVTARRWIPVSGIASDSVDQVRVLVNNEWVDDASEGTFSHGRIYLAQGTNLLRVTGQDGAGNSATQIVEVIQDTSSDTTAPSVTLDLPRDYEISGGVTNWFNRTTFGAAEDLHLKGATDDETAEWSLLVESAGQTNGPFGGTVEGTQLWASVKVFAGTNTLTAMVSDAAGNVSTGIYTVIRDTNFFFEITSPSAYQEMNCASVTVSGVASPAFLMATITVNGVAATITDHGSNVTFTTVTPVSLNLGLTELFATAQLNGRSYYADPPVVGYEVLQWKWTQRGSFDSHDWADDNGGYATASGSYGQEEEWTTAARTWTQAHWFDDTVCDYNVYFDCFSNSYYSVWNCEPYSSSEVTEQYREIWPGYAKYVGSEMLRSDYVEQYATHVYTNCSHAYAYLSPMNCWAHEDAVHSTRIRFIKHWPTQEVQLVILQFGGLDYVRNPGVPLDPSLVTYKGQTGFWYNSQISFVVPIRTRTEYTLKEKDFTWPSFDYAEAVPGFSSGVQTRKGHLLRLNGPSNHVVGVSAECDKAMNSPKEFKFGKTTVESPCGQKAEEAEALVVYFSQAFNYITRGIQDFDVALKVLPDEIPGVQWSKVSGPSSGTLIDPDEAHATFRNPTKGGVYVFDATLGSETTRSQLWLPLAGPEIGSWLETEIAHLATFAANYLSNAGVSRRMFIGGKLWRATDFGPMAAGADWIGSFTGPSSPCGGPETGGDAERHTIFGIVVERHKLSNLLVAYAGRAITGWAEDALIDKFNDYGTPDDVHAIASYEAGFDIFTGSSVQDSIEAHGYDMQVPGWSTREWPSDESPTGGGINRPSAFN